jgi:hypothetical protein
MSKKCLAIGVSSVTPVDPAPAQDPFAYLDGAVVAAETIGLWALNSGFASSDVIVLTDKGANTVTDESLKKAFDALLPEGTTTDHFVLSFTGHGLTGINDDTTYWMLSDSLTEGYDIFVEELRRQLYYYGIQHLTIFSDACRAIANTQNLRTLVTRPGVRKRHQPAIDVQVARFNACQDATSAFMVKDVAGGAPGKCIFSGVLAEALWGRVPDAFDGSVIDSASLGRGLKAAAAKRAKTYNVTLVPGGNPCFDKLIYFDQNTPPQPPNPDLAPWPAAAAVQAVSAGAPTVKMDLESLPPDVFKSVLTDKAVRKDILGVDFGADHPDIDTHRAFPGLPAGAKPIVENVALTRRRLRSSQLPKPRKDALSAGMAEQLRTLEALAAGKARKKKADQVRSSLQRVETASQDAKARLVVNAKVKSIWSSVPIELLRRGPAQSQFALREVPGAQLIVEFADGLFAPVWCYPDLVCTVLRDSDGVAAIVYRNVNGADKGASVATDAISRLATGNMTSDEVDRLATALRESKHVNPVFGAIAAYCYDLTGDLNSIRRMAAFYQINRQAAPYDIVFLSIIENDGRAANVPAIARDDRRVQDGTLPPWLTQATPAVRVSIAGRCPWLRQGWDFLSTPEDSELPLVDGLMQVRTHLTRAPFTTLDKEGGKTLADKWQLEPKPG